MADRYRMKKTTLAGMFFAKGMTTIVSKEPVRVTSEGFLALKELRITVTPKKVPMMLPTPPVSRVPPMMEEAMAFISSPAPLATSPLPTWRK